MASVRKRGNKWQTQIRRTGHRPITRTFFTKKDAETWARQVELLADRHDLPSDPNILRQLSLGDLVRRYRDTVSIHKRTANNERIGLNAFLRHPICSKALSELRTSDFAAYRDERLKDIKPATLKRALVPVRHLFKIAKNEWDIPIRESPLDKLRLECRDQRRERRLKAGEMQQIIEAARSCQNSLVLPIIRLALATGMRRSEILNLKSGDVDLGNRCLLIADSKNGHPRHIPLSAEAINILASLSPQPSKLFPITPNAFRLTWQRLRAKAGIDDLHFHDLRHEAISRFFEIGLSVPEVALISGHREIRMLFRYTHPQRESIIAKMGVARPPNESDTQSAPEIGGHR